MVYNAMKLFMEINPTLFDECSAEYTEHQNTADERKAARKSRWDQIEALAKQKGGDASGMSSVANGSSAPARSKVVPPPKIDEVDPAAQDNQERLDALKLQDDGSNIKDNVAGSEEPLVAPSSTT